MHILFYTIKFYILYIKFYTTIYCIGIPFVYCRFISMRRMLLFLFDHLTAILICVIFIIFIFDYRNTGHRNFNFTSHVLRYTASDLNCKQRANDATIFAESFFSILCQNKIWLLVGSYHNLTWPTTEWNSVAGNYKQSSKSSLTYAVSSLFFEQWSNSIFKLVYGFTITAGRWF